MSAVARCGALVGVALLLLSLTLTDHGLLSSKGVGDTGHYQQYGEHALTGAVPYRDFFVEFPPLALPVLTLPALGPDSRYVPQFKALETLFLAGAIVFLALTMAALGHGRRRTIEACAVAGISAGVLGPIAISSFDPWPTLFAAGALAALVAGRDRLGGAALGLGAAAKLFPLALGPLAVLHVARSHGLRAGRATLLALVAAGLAVAAPFALAAPGGLGYSLETQLTRGLQIESLGGSALLVADRLGLYDARVVVGDPYSLDLAGRLADAVGALHSVAQLAALGLALLLYLRGPATPARLALAAAATTVALVTLGKVLSPQYLVWLIPLVPICGRRASALLLAACALTHVWFPGRFDEVVAVGGVSWVVLLRNLVLVALFALLLVRLRPAPRAAPRAAGS